MQPWPAEGAWEPWLLFEQNPVPLLVCNAESGAILRANAAAAACYGYSAGDLAALRLADLACDAAPDLSPAQDGPLATRHRRRDGCTIDVELQLRPLPLDGRAALLVAVYDVSARVAREAELLRRALHDDLTGLPNRVLLHDRLAQALAVARRECGVVALLLFDLDHFKEINDGFGHHAGDAALQQIGARVQETVRRTDTVARLGGDEFAVVLPGADADAARLVAEKVRSVVERPLLVEGGAVATGVSIGIACFPGDGDDSTTLLRHADGAMYAAKRAHSGISLYALAG